MRRAKFTNTRGDVLNCLGGGEGSSRHEASEGRNDENTKFLGFRRTKLVDWISIPEKGWRKRSYIRFLYNVRILSSFQREKAAKKSQLLL